jgi:hypothetical protein
MRGGAPAPSGKKAAKKATEPDPTGEKEPLKVQYLCIFNNAVFRLKRELATVDRVSSGEQSTLSVHINRIPTAWEAMWAIDALASHADLYHDGGEAYTISTSKGGGHAGHVRVTFHNFKPSFFKIIKAGTFSARLPDDVRPIVGTREDAIMGVSPESPRLFAFEFTLTLLPAHDDTKPEERRIEYVSILNTQIERVNNGFEELDNPLVDEVYQSVAGNTFVLCLTAENHLAFKQHLYPILKMAASDKILMDEEMKKQAKGVYTRPDECELTMQLYSAAMVLRNVSEVHYPAVLRSVIKPDHCKLFISKMMGLLEEVIRFLQYYDPG